MKEILRQMRLDGTCAHKKEKQRCMKERVHARMSHTPWATNMVSKAGKTLMQWITYVSTERAAERKGGTNKNHTCSIVSALIKTCKSSSSLGSARAFLRPSFTLPFPRITILAPVSRSNFFCVFPRGPRIRPMNGYPANQQHREM